MRPLATPITIFLHLLGPAWPSYSTCWHDPTWKIPPSNCLHPERWTETEGMGKRNKGARGQLWVGLHPSLWHLEAVVWPSGAWLFLTPEPLCLLADQVQGRHRSGSGCGKPLLAPPPACSSAVSDRAPGARTPSHTTACVVRLATWNAGTEF